LNLINCTWEMGAKSVADVLILTLGTKGRQLESPHVGRLFHDILARQAKAFARAERDGSPDAGRGDHFSWDSETGSGTTRGYFSDLDVKRLA
jgi:hypothetical protein